MTLTAVSLLCNPLVMGGVTVFGLGKQCCASVYAFPGPWESAPGSSTDHDSDHIDKCSTKRLRKRDVGGFYVQR